MSSPEAIVYDLVVSDYVRAELEGNQAQMREMHQVIGSQNISLLAGVATELRAQGVNVVFTTPDTVIDTTPGTNRYVTHGTGLANAEQVHLLEQYAPQVRTLASVTLGAVLDGEVSLLEGPMVLKNTWDQQGRNKLAVDDEEAAEKVLEWAEQLDAVERNDFYLEERVHCPSDYFSSYRLTALSTGDIIAVTLKYASTRRTRRAEVDNPLLIPLVNERSHLFIDSKAITSNAATGGNSVALDTPTHSIFPELTTKERQVLEAHGIQDRQVPTELYEAGVAAARAIGPSQAFMTGIDFIQDRESGFAFLESNSSPSLNNVRKTVGLSLSDDHIYIMASRMFARALQQPSRQ